MKLEKKDLYLLSQCAISAAFLAGKIISESARESLNIENKKDKQKAGGNGRVGDTLASQVVTEVDVKCQEIILETLAPTFDLYDLALLAEESPDDGSRFNKDYFWCIDPLDGTLAFTRNEPGFSVSIGLVSKQGEPIIGVVYDVYDKVLYHAVKGYGLYKNGKKWAPELSFPDVNRSLNFLTDYSFLEHPFYSQAVERLGNLAKDLGYDGIKQHYYGGAAMNACKVLDLAPSLFFKLPKKEDGGGCLWDYSASSAIFGESSAFVSDTYGEPLELNNTETPFMNKRGVLYVSDEKLAQQLVQMFTLIK